MVLPSLSSMMKYHPRKGAKTVSNLVHLLVIRYHPHKGAKTTSRPAFGLDFPYHPRKGAKTGADFFIRFSISTIPVRGQKTPHQKKMRSFSFANLNFLFSVGCSSMNGTIAAAVIFSLLRLFHSDKMCYNKANSKHLLQN